MALLSIINAVILSFLVAEAVRALFFTKDWRFRFNHSIRPIEHWKKIAIIMVLFVFFFPLINWLFVQYVSLFLDLLGWYQLSLLFVLLPVTYLWIDKRILSLKWNKRDVIPVAIIFIDVVISAVI